MELQVKECYKKSVEKAAAEMRSLPGFKFAAVADTHLDNSVSDTAANIAAVDKRVNFKCLVHLGDFLNGNLSRRYTMSVMHEQTELFRNCIHQKPFFPVQGNHDGYTDFSSAYSPNMAVDEDWSELIAFTGQYENLCRKLPKPYYYVDFPDYKIRMIILCTFYYTGFYDGVPYSKVYGTDDAQTAWFENEALDVKPGFTVMVFSHDTPFEDFENPEKDNPRPNGNRLMEILKNKAAENGFSVAAWFAGHFHGDYIGNVNGINFVLVASETAYVPQLWDMPCGGYYPQRTLNTESEDLWDGIVLDTNARVLRLIRFGAGKNREITY